MFGVVAAQVMRNEVRWLMLPWDATNEVMESKLGSTSWAFVGAVGALADAIPMSV